MNTTSASTCSAQLSNLPHGRSSCKHNALRGTPVVRHNRRSQPVSAAHRRPLTLAAASEGAVEVKPADTADAAAKLLRIAADGRPVKKEDIFAAVKDLDKQRLKGGEQWAKTLGGDKSPGRRWRLIWTAGKEELAKDRKGEAVGKGKFFPLTAAQRFDAESGIQENGAYLGHVASLIFMGPYDFTKNKLAFKQWDVDLKLGPWKTSFNIKKGDKDAQFDASDKGLPFYVFFYIDEHIAVAKGRGGGWAYWARTDPKWDLEHGIV